MALNVETLVRCGVPRDKARVYLPLLARGMREFGITTRPRARMYLANLLHESAGFKYMEEIASGRAYEGRRDLGNTQRGDGVRFKGRGPIQLTGRSNYSRYGKLLGVNLIKNPKLAAEPRIGFRTAAAYFKLRGLNELADRGDFRGVCKGINGGFNGYADRCRYYEKLKGLGVVPGEAYIKRGDKGDQVVVLTRRLSKLVSPATHKPYLDGKRKVFDRETEKALRRFQKDHKLKIDGALGPKTVQALTKAVAERKRQRVIAAKRAARAAGAPKQPAREPVKAGAKESPARRPEPAVAKQGKAEPADAGRPGRRFGREPARAPEGAAVAAAGATASKTRSATSEEILARIDAHEDRSAQLREALRRRHAALLRIVGDDRPLEAHELRSLYEDLGRLDAAVDSVRARLAAATGAPPPAPSAAQPPAAQAPAAQPPSATQPPAAQPPAVESPATTAPTPPPTAPAAQAEPPGAASGGNGSLDTLEFDELMTRLDDTDTAADEVRAEIGRRSAILEQRLVEERARRAREHGVAEPKAPRPPREERHEAQKSKSKAVSVKRKPAAPEEEEPGGHVAEKRAGDSAHIVKQSKFALARYLKTHRPKKTSRLRARLLLEARNPRKARLATPTWERGVRWAQKAANLKVTGVMDRRLEKELRAHWPSDAFLRRALRSTPAWRTIPGQLTRNFNVREFACNDGTSYVNGLMREQGLTKRQATDRAKRLARYLERVRTKEGGRAIRPNSAFRSKAHNARVGGERNSAHLRGFAIDVPPPRGVSLAAHRNHMRAVFPSGIGYYPRSNFVHGDFDPALGRRAWNG
jgi:predicted chitinase/uncharacterized protein YcbK (DUF882 family)